MGRRNQRKQFDINAQIMSGGVGLAALEAMFNLVNTQSTLSASMVRDHEMYGPVQLQALAGALAQIMAVTECACINRAVAVDIPSCKAKNNNSSDNKVGHEFGAISGVDALNKLLDKSKGDTTNTTTTNAIDHVVLQRMINEQTHQLHDQMVDIAGGSSQKLAVT